MAITTLKQASIAAAARAAQQTTKTQSRITGTSSKATSLPSRATGGYSSISGATVYTDSQGKIVEIVNPEGTASITQQELRRLEEQARRATTPPSRIPEKPRIETGGRGVVASFERPEVLEQARQQRTETRISATAAAEQAGRPEIATKTSRIPTVERLEQIGRNIESGQRRLEPEIRKLNVLYSRFETSRDLSKPVIERFERQGIKPIYSSKAGQKEGEEFETVVGFQKQGQQINITPAMLGIQEKQYAEYQKNIEGYNQAVEEYMKQREKTLPSLNLLNEAVGLYEKEAKLLEAQGKIKIVETPTPQLRISEETKAALTATPAAPIIKLEKPKIIERKEGLEEIGLGFVRATTVPIGALQVKAIESVADISRQLVGAAATGAEIKVIKSLNPLKYNFKNELTGKAKFTEIEKLKIQTARRAGEEIGDIASYFLPGFGQLRVAKETLEEVKAGRTAGVLETAGTALLFSGLFRGAPKVVNVLGDVIGGGAGRGVSALGRVGTKATGLGFLGVIGAGQAASFAESAYLPEKDFQAISRQRAKEFGLFLGYAGAFEKGIAKFEAMKAKQFARKTPARVSFEAMGKTKGDIDEAFESRTKIQSLKGKIQTDLGEREFMATLRLADVETAVKRPKRLEEGITILKPIERKPTERTPFPFGEKGISLEELRQLTKEGKRKKAEGIRFIKTKFAEPEILDPFEKRITRILTADIFAKDGKVIMGEQAKAIKVSLKESPSSSGIYFKGKREPVLEASGEAEDIYKKLLETKIIRTIGKGKLFEGKEAKQPAAGVEAGQGLMAEFVIRKAKPKVTAKRILSLEFGETTGIKTTEVEVFKTLGITMPKGDKFEFIKFPQPREIFRRRGSAISIRGEKIGKEELYSEPIGTFLQMRQVYATRGKKGVILVKAPKLKTKSKIDITRKDIGQVIVEGATEIDFTARVKDSTTDVLNKIKGGGKKRPMKPFKFPKDDISETINQSGKSAMVQLQKAGSKAETKLSEAQKERAIQKVKEQAAAQSISIAKALGIKAKQVFAEEIAMEFFAPKTFQGVMFFGGTKKGFGEMSLLKEKNLINEAAKNIEKNITKELSKGTLKEILKPVTKEIQKPITKLFPKELLKPLAKEIPKEVSKEIPKEITKPLSKLIPKEILKPIGKPIPKIISPIIPKTPVGALFKIKLPLFKSKLGKEQGYHAYVKEEPYKRSRFIKVTKNPLAFEAAKARGQFVADQTISQTIELRKAKGKVRQAERQAFGLDFKFYSPKKKTNRLIEKRGFAIDTAGEVRKLKVSRFLAEERKRRRKGAWAF